MDKKLPREFLEAYREQALAAYGDSNDAEIDSLREALSLALEIITDAGFDMRPVENINQLVEELTA